MKTLLLPLLLVICFGRLANAQRQGADVNELGRFIGRTVEISGVFRKIVRPVKHQTKTVLVIEDDMLSGISVRVVMMRSKFSSAMYKWLDSSKNMEVFVNAKIKKVNGQLMGFNYELKPNITTIMPLPSCTANAITPSITAVDALKYLGKYVLICDTVHDYIILKDSIYLNLGGKYPDETLIVAGSRKEIPRPDNMIGKAVSVNGQVMMYKQKPIVRSKNIFVK